MSLERPYKDDSGLPLPVLLDITPSGEHIYEPYAFHVTNHASISQRSLQHAVARIGLRSSVNASDKYSSSEV